MSSSKEMKRKPADELLEARNEYNFNYKGRIEEKMSKADPFNFFLSTIKDCPVTNTEELSITFAEMLDPCLGKLLHVVHINYMVELGWLLAQHLITNNTAPCFTLLYQSIDVENFGNLDPNKIILCKITPKNAFSHHHTKMSIFFYEDRSVRFAVYTGNLIESDWENRTQGIWLSPKCPYLGDNIPINYGESVTYFKRDILDYLKSYNLPQLKWWIARIQRVNVSSINVFLIPSIPGNLPNCDVGLRKVSKILNQHGCPDHEHWDLIAQCSSIGSLGKGPNNWLFNDFTQYLKSEGNFKLIYPSAKAVRDSFPGSWGCLPYSSNTHYDQKWLENYLYHWISSRRYRTRAMPHIKTYMKLSPDGEKISWFLLTSANLSKAAWGVMQRKNVFSCSSHEMGVLFVPKIIINENYFSVEMSGRIHHNTSSRGFPIPYDIPLEKYKLPDDEIYLCNKKYS